MSLYARTPKSRSRRPLRLFSRLAQYGNDWLRSRPGRRRHDATLITSVYALPEVVKGRVHTVR